MQYLGPAAVDFAEVVALNRAFLVLVNADPNAPQFLRGLDESLACRLRSLTPAQCERLACAPFLLFSVGEGDVSPWADQGPSAAPEDLFAEASGQDAQARLMAAALGFVWQLARQNAHSLRLLTGASLHWCERLADQPLLTVIERGSADPELLRLRGAENTSVWQKLLVDGVRQRETLRVAAQLSAMHMMVTGLGAVLSTRWASAACRSRPPTLSVAGDCSNNRLNNRSSNRPDGRKD